MDCGHKSWASHLPVQRGAVVIGMKRRENARLTNVGLPPKAVIE
jgi:hypothetical protein